MSTTPIWPVEAVVFSVNGLVAICERNEIRLYDSYSTQTGLPPRHRRHGRTILAQLLARMDPCSRWAAGMRNFQLLGLTRQLAPCVTGSNGPVPSSKLRSRRTEARSLRAVAAAITPHAHINGDRVALCDVATGALRHELRPIECVFTVAFSGDGVYLAVGGYKRRRAIRREDIGAPPRDPLSWPGSQCCFLPGLVRSCLAATLRCSRCTIPRPAICGAPLKIV